MILFTQSTAVLHKHLNDEVKIICLLQFFLEVAQNSPRIPWSLPRSEKSLSTPGFPGLWPPCRIIIIVAAAAFVVDKDADDVDNDAPEYG